MVQADAKKKPTGYDKYVNWTMFSIPLGLLFLLMLIPTPRSMMDVGVEYALGPAYVQELFAQELFGRKPGELEQWQIQAVRMMETSVQKSSFSKAAFLKRDEKWCKDNKIPCTGQHLKQVMAFVDPITPERFQAMSEQASNLRLETLSFDGLRQDEKPKAEKAGFRVKAGVGIVLFVVLCFVTEAIPLPMVAFCVGIIALCTGIVDRGNVASLYWSDATWFIMGSLMFAAAFVKTGVDKKIAMMMFGRRLCWRFWCRPRMRYQRPGRALAGRCWLAM